MKKRIEQLRTVMNEKSLDAYVVDGKENIRYFTGVCFPYDGEAWFLVLANKAVLVTDSRYREVSEKSAYNNKAFEVKIHEGRLLFCIKELLSNKKKVGFDSTSMSYDFAKKLVNSLDNCEPIGDLVASISESKEKKELKDTKEALGISEHVLHAHIIPLIKPGVSEKRLATEISYQHSLHGAEGDSFSPIVLTGKNTSLPHGIPSDDLIKEGQHVQFDIGCVVNGVCSDYSRIVSLGEPSKEKRRVFNALLAGQQAAIRSVTAGMLCRDFHSVAKDEIAKYGYIFNGHGVGHGTGIVIHCRPYLSPRAKEAVIPLGAIFTVEPGIYDRKWGGMRIENMVHLGPNGAEVLNTSSDELIIL